MATKRELIAQAFEELGIASYIFDASPEELQSARSRLDRIAAQWDGQSIRVSYNTAGGLDDDAGIPDTTENCFALHLAIAMASSFGKTVSQDTRNAATAAWNALYVSRGVMPTVTQPDFLPRGVGQKRGVIDSQYYEGGTDVDGLDSGATQY